MLKYQTDLLSLVDQYYSYLASRSLTFDARGFPVLRSSMFLNEWPDLVIPYAHRHDRVVSDLKKTSLCMFESDHLIYPRLERIFLDLEEYRKYQGVIMSDLTVTSDMDSEWQDFIMLLNQLYIAILAVNDVRIILNTRCTGTNFLRNFKSIPRHVMCASGFLGCSNSRKDDFCYIAKILTLQPSKLILYGKHDYVVEHQLVAMGVEFRVYKDFHRLSREVA